MSGPWSWNKWRECFMHSETGVGRKGEEMVDYLNAMERHVKPQRIVDQWDTRCSWCYKYLGDFVIYLEDRGGNTEGRANVLASYTLCSPKCLREFTTTYGAGVNYDYGR